MEQLLLDSSQQQHKEGNRKRKKTRRSQVKRNILKNTKLMMVNIRGMKCKENSLKEIIHENQPTVLMVMETLCPKNDEPDIEGYTIRSPKMKRKEEWGGIMIAIRNEFAHQIQVKSEHTETAEILFIQMICGRETVTLGLVYAPQENETSIEEIDKMYQYLENEIEKAKTENHIIVIGGDFNCKIGKVVKGNRKEITKGGRRLLKMARSNEMKIMNSSERCTGTWTRTQIEKGKPINTVIDYILISEEHESYIKNMEIDEGKEITPTLYQLEKHIRTTT